MENLKTKEYDCFRELSYYLICHSKVEIKKNKTRQDHSTIWIFNEHGENPFEAPNRNILGQQVVWIWWESGRSYDTTRHQKYTLRPQRD